MGCYIDQSGNYYEGDPQPGTVSVPQRPDATYDWNGAAWVVNAQRVAAAQQAAKDATDAAAASVYAKLVALKGMTPAQVQAWVAANVTNLAAAQDAIATLAIAVSILARRL